MKKKIPLILWQIPLVLLLVCSNNKMLQLLPVKYQQPVDRNIQIPALALCQYVYNICEDENGKDPSHHLSSFNQ